MWYINLSRANLSFPSIGSRALRCSSLERFFISDNKRTATYVCARSLCRSTEADRPVITWSHSLFKLLRRPVAPRRRLALIHNAGPIRTPRKINECDFRDVCWTSSRYNDRGRSTSAAGSRTDKRRICIISLFLRFHRKMNKRTASPFRSILSIRLIKPTHLHNVAVCLRVVAPRRDYFRRWQTFISFSPMHNIADNFPKYELGANVRSNFIDRLSTNLYDDSCFRASIKISREENRIA